MSKMSEKKAPILIEFAKYFLMVAIPVMVLTLPLAVLKYFGGPLVSPQTEFKIGLDAFELPMNMSTEELDEHLNKACFYNPYAIDFHGKVAITGPSFLHRFLPFLQDILNRIATLLVMWFLFKVFRNISAGNTFSQANFKLLRYVGMTIFAYALLAYMLYGLISEVYHEYFVIWGFYLESIEGYQLNTLFIGFLVWIVAEIFRQGAIMQEDQKLTI